MRVCRCRCTGLACPGTYQPATDRCVGHSPPHARPCRVPPEDAAHLSLQAVADVAAAVGGADHGFRYIQLPIGAGMPEAWQQPWQELRGAGGGDARRATALEAAQEASLVLHVCCRARWGCPNS